MRASVLLIMLILFACRVPVAAQAIRGEVLDMDNKHAIEGVSIENIYTSLDIFTGEQGEFVIAAAGGQLLEFKKQGYKTTRVRVPQGFIPPYFRIIMKKGITEIKDVYLADNRYNYKSDSQRYYDLYKHELDFPRMSSFEMIQHPFSALSHSNKEKWRFQDDYEQFEQQKFVDKSFNAEIINRITGLKGDSLQSYIRRYKPTYQQLRQMNDYAFFNYIKNTVQSYRSYMAPRGAQ